jgi:hypothetical protein
MRSQSVVSAEEAETGEKLIAAYREQEAIAAEHDIEVRQHQLERLKGIPAEAMRREIAGCDYAKWQAAQARLAELRKEAFELVKPVFRRLAKSLDDELNAGALAAEQRLDAAGISLRDGDTWLLHLDVLCRALWSQRHTVESTLVALAEHGDGIGSVQWFLTDEPGVPFQWFN